MTDYGKAWDEFIKATSIWNVQICKSNADSYHKWPEYVFNRVKPFINKDSVVVDIGCGTGGFCNLINPLVKFVYGFDTSQTMINYAKTHNSTREILFELGWGNLRPAQDDTVDLVNSTLCFQHLNYKDVINYLKESHRVLKKGGIIHFQILGDHTKIGHVSPTYKTDKITDHGYSESAIRNMLVVAGFEEINIEKDKDWYWVNGKNK